MGLVWLLHDSLEEHPTHELLPLGGTGTYCNLKINCCGNASSSSSSPVLTRERVTSGTTVYPACSSSSSREPWEGWWSGEGGQGTALAATSACHPSQVLLPWARNRLVAATRANLSQSRLPCRLWAQKHHPAHVWLMQTPGHTEAARSCSDCSAEAHAKKSQQPNNHHHTPAPKTLSELKSQVQIRSLSPISVINTVCFHAALQVLSPATALHRYIYYFMLVSQIRKAKARAITFRSTGF